jgi:hypothetical protein
MVLEVYVCIQKLFHKSTKNTYASCEEATEAEARSFSSPRIEHQFIQC